MQSLASSTSASGHARLRAVAYYVQRAVTSPAVRHVANRLLVAALRKFEGEADVLSHYKSSQAEHLRKTGHIELGKLLGRGECDAIHDYLRGRTMTDVRGTGQVFRIDEVPSGVRLGDYPLDTVVHCPHVLEVANRPDLVKLAASYLGYKPMITGIGLRWSFPGEPCGDQVQSFHRDAELGVVKLLVYLTDVDNASGPHVYVEGTHRERMPLRLRPYSNEEIARKYGSGVHVMGPAGTGFVIDPKGIHRGIPPARRARLVLVVQYSLLPSLLYDYVPVECAKATQFDRYVNKLIVADLPASAEPVACLVPEAQPILHE
jgi:hypothetical protein